MSADFISPDVLYLLRVVCGLGLVGGGLVSAYLGIMTIGSIFIVRHNGMPSQNVARRLASGIGCLLLCGLFLVSAYATATPGSSIPRPGRILDIIQAAPQNG